MKRYSVLSVGIFALLFLSCDKNSDVVVLDSGISNRTPPHAPNTLNSSFSRGFGINNFGVVTGCVRNGYGQIVAFALSHQGIWFSDETVAPEGIPTIRFSVNDKGHVAGQRVVPGGIAPVVWKNGQAYDLPLLPGYEFGEVFDINNKGQMVGESLNGNYVSPTENRPTVFSLEGATDLGTLGGNIGAAVGINEKGEIVGWAETSTPGQTRAFLYKDGVMKDLGTLGGPWSNATAINNKSEIVGRTVLADGVSIRGFLWVNGQMTNIGTLGGNSSVAQDINDRGEIVGFSRISSGPFHAFIYSDGVMTDLGALLPGNDSRAISINNDGDVTGYYTHPNGSVHAFLYRNGEMIEL
ncbi:MAG TPA: hypothetical protein VGK46_15045 [Saprospiraceae bacterium]